MPHLSPMNWILAILMFWSILMISMSKSWWNNISIMPFITPSISKSKSKNYYWKWN